jgi:hypothetical protein
VQFVGGLQKRWPALAMVQIKIDDPSVVKILYRFCETASSCSANNSSPVMRCSSIVGRSSGNGAIPRHSCQCLADACPCGDAAEETTKKVGISGTLLRRFHNIGNNTSSRSRLRLRRASPGAITSGVQWQLPIAATHEVVAVADPTLSAWWIQL